MYLKLCKDAANKQFQSQNVVVIGVGPTHSGLENSRPCSHVCLHGTFFGFKNALDTLLTINIMSSRRKKDKAAEP